MVVGANSSVQDGTAMVIKNSLHELVEELPEEELSTALRFLQYLRDVGGDPFVETVIPEIEEEDELSLDDLPLEDQEQSVADAWQKYLDTKTTPGQGF